LETYTVARLAVAEGLVRQVTHLPRRDPASERCAVGTGGHTPATVTEQSDIDRDEKVGAELLDAEALGNACRVRQPQSP
jgi:hypothetical protein